MDMMKGTRTEGNQGIRSISVAMVRCVFDELAARYGFSYDYLIMNICFFSFCFFSTFIFLCRTFMLFLLIMSFLFLEEKKKKKTTVHLSSSGNLDITH